MKTSDPPVPSVRGTLILNMLEITRAHYGRVALENAIDRLDPEQRSQIEQATPLSWVPNDTQAAFFLAVAAEAGLTIEELIDECVPLATEQSFKTVWRIFLRVLHPHALVTRASAMFGKTRNVGDLAVTHRERGKAFLALTGWPEATDGHLRATAVAIQTVLRLAGRKHAKCSYQKTDSGGSFEVVWIPSA